MTDSNGGILFAALLIGGLAAAHFGAVSGFSGGPAKVELLSAQAACEPSLFNRCSGKKGGSSVFQSAR